MDFLTKSLVNNSVGVHSVTTKSNLYFLMHIYLN